MILGVRYARLIGFEVRFRKLDPTASSFRATRSNWALRKRGCVTGATGVEVSACRGESVSVGGWAGVAEPNVARKPRGYAWTLWPL